MRAEPKSFVPLVLLCLLVALFRHLDASVEDVCLGKLLILGDDDREALVLTTIFSLKETNRAMVLRVVRVADASFLVSGPASRLHAIIRIEILNFLGGLVRTEGDEINLTLHHAADEQTRSKWDLKIGFGCALKRWHVGPKRAHGASIFVARKSFAEFAGKGHAKNQS